MKTILCLIDDTSSGKTALEIAHQFFDRAPYKIVIARIEPADRIENREYFLARLHELSQEIFLSGIERQGDIRIEIAFGNFPDQCRVLVDKHHASLLIIGRRKKKIHEGVFFGETTHKMIQRLDIPVIISPEEGKAPALTTIYYATDFSPGSISTLDVLLPWCSGLRLHLHLLHVSETEEEEFKATAKMKWAWSFRF
jgi:nucleotide-binding universal stress UspA family protein